VGDCIKGDWKRQIGNDDLNIDSISGVNKTREIIVSLLPTISNSAARHIFDILDSNDDSELSWNEYSVWAKEMIVIKHYYDEFENYILPFLPPISSLSTIHDIKGAIPDSVSINVINAIEELVSKDENKLQQYFHYFHRYS